MLTRKKGLRRRHRAIGVPTAADIDYRERARALGCVACLARGIEDVREHCGAIEAHHRTTGDLHGQKQLGHRELIALGSWHHRGALSRRLDEAGMLDRFGPSLALHKRAFVEWLQDTTGERSTAALQRYQDDLLA